MLTGMSTVEPTNRLAAPYRPHPDLVDVAPLVKEQNLQSTANSAIEEIDAEEEFFGAEEFIDHGLPSAPNGKSLQVTVRGAANDYFNSLGGQSLAIKPQIETRKALIPEVWTIKQTTDLIDRFNSARPLLKGNWASRSKLSNEEKRKSIVLFINAINLLNNSKRILEEKLAQALVNNKSDSDSLGADIFTQQERTILEKLPKFLEEIQEKSEGLYKEGDTLSERTVISLIGSATSFLAMIAGALLPKLGLALIIPAAVALGITIVAAITTLIGIIAIPIFYFADKKNKAESENWAQDIKGLTSLIKELDTLKGSEMWNATVEAKQAATQAYQAVQDSLINQKANQTAIANQQESIQKLAERFDKFVEPLAQKVDVLFSQYSSMGRRGSDDSLSSASSGHDSGVEVRKGGLSPSLAEWKAFKSEQKTLLREKALILRSELNKIEGNTEDLKDQIISLLISEALKSESDKLYTEIVADVSSKLNISGDTETALYRKGEPYFVMARKLKACYEKEDLPKNKIEQNLYKYSGINDIIARTADENALKAA